MPDNLKIPSHKEILEELDAAIQIHEHNRMAASKARKGMTASGWAITAHQLMVVKKFIEGKSSTIK